MRILVVQTTRMGDVLQTSPLIRALKTKHRDAHIALMVRRMGRPIAERHPDVDEIIVYDEDQMFRNLCAGDSDKLLRAYQQATEYVERLQAGRFDVAYNCTQSIGSAMLLKLARIPEVVGADLSDDWQFVRRGGWTNYLFTSICHRDYSDINLCDIFSHLAEETAPVQELVFEVRNEDREAARELLDCNSVGPNDFLACLQLGASENEKRWPEFRFAGLARLLREHYQAQIALLGVKEEGVFGREFAQHCPEPVIALFGKTTIPVLAALLERADVLVTNDTGTMHIAAAVKCPIVLVSVGPVHFRETGPYGTGHCAVERRRETLGRTEYEVLETEQRAQIRPEQVLRAVDLVLNTPPGGLHEQIEDCPELQDVVLYQSGFAPDGFLQWYPVLRRPIGKMDLLRIAYRSMWLDSLEPDRQEEKGIESVQRILNRFLPPEESPVQAQSQISDFVSPSASIPGTNVAESDFKSQLSNIKSFSPRTRTQCPEAGPSSSVPVGEEETLQVWARGYGELFMRLAGLAQRGQETTTELIEALENRTSMQKAHELVRDLVRLDEETRLFGEINPPARPLAAIARFERDNLEGSDPLILAQTTFRIYSDLQRRALLMKAKLDDVSRVWVAL